VKKSIFKRWWFWVIVVIVLIGAIGSSGEDTPSASPAASGSVTAPASSPAPAPEVKKEKFEVLESSYVQEQYSSKIVGKIKNNTDKEYGYVQVEINLYDDSGAQVGSTMANVNNLEAGGTWNFEAPILEDKATKYKIKDVTGF
jgi:hypothetical protein